MCMEWVETLCDMAYEKFFFASKLVKENIIFRLHIQKFYTVFMLLNSRKPVFAYAIKGLSRQLSSDVSRDKEPTVNKHYYKALLFSVSFLLTFKSHLQKTMFELSFVLHR